MKENTSRDREKMLLYVSTGYYINDYPRLKWAKIIIDKAWTSEKTVISNFWEILVKEFICTKVDSQ